MKASYLWRAGPRAAQEIVLEKIRRVEMGAAAPGRLEIPGAEAGRVWAVVEFDNGRCYLTNSAAPVPILIARKVSGQIQSVEVKPGERVETKTHDVLRFGPDGPELYCQYEMELSDRFGVALDEMEDAVSPISADRRKQRVLSKNIPSRTDVQRVAEQVGQEGRLWRRKIFVLGVVGVLAFVAVGAFAVYLQRGTEQRIAGMAQILADSQASYERNLKMLEATREDARSELARLRQEERKLDPNDPALAALREQIDAFRLELKENQPLEKTFSAMQKTLDAALFFVVCRVRASKRIFKTDQDKLTEWSYSMGTGFVADTDGTLVTCKHVVQPWKYSEMAAMLKNFGARVEEVRYEAYPVGYCFRGSGGDEVAAEVFTSGNGRLRLVSWAPDELTETRVDLLGERVLVEVEAGYENDIALLKLSLPNSTPLRLATDEDFQAIRTKKVYPVMVAGFPLGIRAIENGKIESSVALGTVRKIERLIQHTAPTCNGNSGGPLLDAQGRVIGVVSYIMTGEKVQNLNVCVPVTVVNRCLRKGN